MSYQGFPLFRLNSLQVRYWLAGGDFRWLIARTVSKTYRTGVVILSPTLHAIGTVDPRGNTQDLPPPHKTFQMWEICNKPSIVYNECACRNFWDPEAMGPWHLRDKERKMDRHHPFCQFDRVAMPTWQQSYRTGHELLGKHQNPQARPDEWIRTSNEMAQK